MNRDRNTTMRYFVYCRKSSEQEDKQILSLESQEKELRDYVQKESLNIVDVYKETGSAHVIGRNNFNEMLSRIEKGDANGLIVWDESRIARNSLDGGKVIYMIDLKQIVEIRKPGKIYRNTPDDKSWLSMVFMMSKKESDDKAVNVRRGLIIKAQKGWFPSGAKPGYTNDKYAEQGARTIRKDEIKFPLIKKAWDLMLTGSYTPPQILDILNNEWGYRTPQHKKIGGSPMSRSKIYEVFTDSFYYGYFRYPKKDGEWYRGSHEPMITKEQFDRVQVLLGRKGNPRAITKEFPFTGIIQCGECGAMVTCEEKWQVICPTCRVKFTKSKMVCPKCSTLIEQMKNPIILHYVYYHCTKSKNPHCSQGSIEVTKLNTHIDDLLSQLQISERFTHWAIKRINEMNDYERVDRNSILGSLQDAYNDVVKRIDGLIKMKISPQNSDGSFLSDSEYKEQKAALMKEKTALAEKLADTDARINRWVELSEKTFNFACYARYWFAHGDLQTKRQIFIGCGSNIILKDKTLRLDVKKPLEYIAAAKKVEVSISPTFEPTKQLAITTSLEDYWAKNTTLC